VVARVEVGVDGDEQLGRRVGMRPEQRLAADDDDVRVVGDLRRRAQHVLELVAAHRVSAPRADRPPLGGARTPANGVDCLRSPIPSSSAVRAAVSSGSGRSSSSSQARACAGATGRPSASHRSTRARACATSAASKRRATSSW